MALVGLAATASLDRPVRRTDMEQVGGYMSITDNYCPAGLMNMRRHWRLTEDQVVKVKGRNAWRATCPVCDRPDTPAVKEGDHWVLSGHKENNLEVVADTENNRYIKRRERQW